MMAALDGNLKIPVIGEVPKKVAYGAVGVAVAIGIVMTIRSRSAAAGTTAADASGTDTADTTETDPSLDPNTGLPYADESGGGAYDAGTGNLETASGYDTAGYPLGSAADLAWQASQQSGITTNDEWLSQAMTSVPGDSATIQAALAGVLGGLTVTTAQKDLFLEAVGINGAPPQGYPQPIKTTDTAAHPASTGKVVVPPVTGETQSDAFRAVSAAGLKPHGSPGVKGKTLTVMSQTPRAGTSVARGSSVTLVSKVEK